MPQSLLVIRSSISEDPETFALFGNEGDDERPLTDEGRASMDACAHGLHSQIPRLDLLATSSLPRSRETAEIFARPYGDVKTVQAPELHPGGTPIATLRWLRQHGGREHLALIGHEPSLSRLVGWLLVGSDKPVLSLEQGAACLLRFDREVAAGGASLRWALTRDQLMHLGAGAQATP